MPVARAHTIYGAEFDETVLAGVTQSALQLNPQVRGEPTNGEPYRKHLALVSQDVQASLSTYAIAQALGLMATGVAWKDISALTAGLKLYAQLFADGGTRGATNAHRRYTFTEGIVHLGAITVDHQGDALLTMQVMPIYDGENAIAQITDGVSLPTAVGDTQRFTIGAWQIGGVTIGQITRLEIDFGVTVRRFGSDSDLYHTYSSVETYLPVIRITTTDVEALKAANIPLEGKAATHVNTSGFLRKRAVDGTFVADATAEHIKFTAAGMANIEGGFDAQSNQEGSVTLVLNTRYDGTNNPIVIDAAAAIAGE